MFDTPTLLRTPNPLEIGVFVLMRSVFVVEGKNVPIAGRCDNLTYSGEILATGTPYADEAITTGRNSPYSDYTLPPSGIRRYEHVIDCSPHFIITYLETMMTSPDGTVGVIDIQRDPTPMFMWVGRSMFWLLKNMREWSFMVDAPFNSDHPMATHSKAFFDVLQPSQELIDEIDSWPDMHLAKFLKGQDDYRVIPYPYPEPSQAMKDWLVSLAETYPHKKGIVENLNV